jgi:hypothetical protein
MYALAPALLGWYNLAITRELEIIVESGRSQLEAVVEELSVSDQLRLVERVVQRIRDQRAG